VPVALEYALWVVASLLVVGGIVGTIVPAIPGALLVFIGLVVAAAIDNFDRVGWVILSILFIMTILSYAADAIATGYGAKKVGAGKWATIGAVLGGIVGLFFGIIGIIVGPFVGAFVGELLMRPDLKQAGKSGLGAWLGIVLGSAVKASLAIAMIGIFVAAYFL